ncbi:16S rRNA (cytosine(967)-C(5))-methyltransferase RsmB [Streptococcus chenjunshii]|uniref:16S rRNA (cytosine(967)-C(5))-methyltransferase n=1 Tax=Streptococcus chenjunshii TaxID=2173853 RepID=A0A372KJL6_9STRE|nr:16S rRNA (cytosine(967)-C(5))-methyltransferase RsmB [Streptococcus chenjunshii]AXQ79227.1 16S rRNA (cytosine(967)-C(5))-methyltransferase RsmB [Streptococcus chenjunshii]RFU50263.1 16S rRNA (cytosine(967)-C(5))-methyltransferase RsmB [Streptococcus chenjunshii]RFU52475.1 16S rRNA (cytosine(967)-C(5))-methyltransferase RsmB [Streptococcus chenjunshii]
MNENHWQESVRGTALLILEKIFKEQAYTNITLNHYLERSSLTKRDKNLVTEIVYGTVARKITLEWYLSHVIQDRTELDEWLYYLLMLSLYQLLYLDHVPSHAVVNEAVIIAKKRNRQRGAEKLVNAVLRRLAGGSLPEISSIKRKNKYYSVNYSLPVWLVRKLIEQYGEKRALAIMESLFVRSKASIRVVNQQKKSEIMAATGALESQISPVGLVKPVGHFAETEYFSSGDITIQDESSQLVAPMLNIQGDEDILDACSAPGGKAVHMASYLTSGHIRALDLYDHKLKLIDENARRLHVADKITTQKMDARKVHDYFAADSFDKILVDAPCSGMGLIRRKPDIKYNKALQNVAALQKIQLQIMESVCQTIRKGGIITYSTCTIFAEENFQVIRKFLEEHSDFEQVQLSHKQKNIVKDGCILITPEQYHTDGFFIGQVKRIL